MLPFRHTLPNRRFGNCGIADQAFPLEIDVAYGLFVFGSYETSRGSVYGAFDCRRRRVYSRSKLRFGRIGDFFAVNKTSPFSRQWPLYFRGNEDKPNWTLR